jgi:dethiobiotin synthetase
MMVAVVGTDTGVGKTWITCALAVELMASGFSVVARKPVQSFDEDEPPDAQRLGLATGELPAAVCPLAWSFPVPMAPPMAADLLGRPQLKLHELVEWVVASVAASEAKVAFVELVGGVCSPQAHDGDGLDLLRLLGPDCVVLVARSGIGTLNAVRSSLRSLRSEDCLPTLSPIVVLNRFDPSDELHRRNLSWLHDRDGFDVLTDSSISLYKLASRLMNEL